MALLTGLICYSDINDENNNIMIAYSSDIVTGFESLL